MIYAPFRYDTNKTICIFKDIILHPLPEIQTAFIFIEYMPSQKKMERTLLV